MPALLDMEAFRAAAQAGRAADAAVLRFSTAEPEVREATRTAKFVFSDGSTDLAGDRIDPAGWSLDQYRRNSVCLWSHDASVPPIGRATGVVVRNGQLVGDITFAKAEEYPFADVIYQLIRGKYLNAVSVGFRPLKYSFSKDPNRPYGIDFSTQKLLEVSVCALPCNENALVEARSAGLDTRLLKTWAERALDSGDDGVVPRERLEALRRQAAEPRRGRIERRSASTDTLNRVIDDVKGATYSHRQSIKDLKQAMPSPAPTEPTGIGNPDDGLFDPELVEQAMAHLREAITRQGLATDCLRQSLARPGDNAPSGDQGVEARLAEVARLRRSSPALQRTPAERVAYAAEERRRIGAPTRSRAERVRDAAALAQSVAHLLRGT